jgi:hypothetical protein
MTAKRLVRVLLCVLGLGFLACNLSPIETLPSGRSTDDSGGPNAGTGATGNGTGGVDLGEGSGTGGVSGIPTDDLGGAGGAVGGLGGAVK